MTAVEDTLFYEWAGELGAIVVSIEHRFFGASLPIPFDGSPSSFTPLTLENVLDDAIAFADFVKKNTTGAANSKVILEGGSYPANLVLYFRYKRPDVFFGSFASAPILNSFGPLENNANRFGAAEAVCPYPPLHVTALTDATQKKLSNIYFDESAEAATKIQAAMMEFYTCSLISKNCSSEFLSQMNLCETGSSPNATDLASMYSAAITAYEYSPQFNYPYPTTYEMAYPFKYLINQTLNATTPGEVVKIPLAMTNWESPSQCLDWTSPNITHKLEVDVTPSWSYVVCQYYPIAENAIPSGNLLPPLKATGRNDMCSLGPKYESKNYNQTTEFWQNYLGTSNAQINNTTRLVILQGGYDRVQGIGTPDLTLTSDCQHSRVILTPGLGHTEDMVPQSVAPVGLIPELDLIRDTKLQILKEWLGSYSNETLWTD